MRRLGSLIERQLQDALQRLRDCDSELVRAIERRYGSPVSAIRPQGLDPAAPLALETASVDGFLRGNLTLEAIILRKGRPALAVRDGTFDTSERDDDRESGILLDRLDQARHHLETRIPAVGRIELEGNPEGELAGTGWLVTPEIVVTNAHVAQRFAMPWGGGFRFRTAASGVGPQTARIDFLAEVGNEIAHEVPIREILWVAPDGQPDMAFLRLDQAVDLPPVCLADAPPETGAHVAAIGYPVRDSEYPDLALMEAVFGGLYTHKCLSPGVVRSFAGSILHDCSTMRGNSGSPVIDLGSGKAVGLHFLGGRLDGGNHAVPAPVLGDKLAQLGLI